MAGGYETVSGAREVARNLEFAENLVMDAIGDAVQETAINIHNRWTRSLKQKGSGITYKRANGSHTASAPGQPPATDTGRLASSTHWKMTGEAEAEVGTNVAYFEWLEGGAKHIEPRPSLTPAKEAEIPAIPGTVKKHVGKAIG